MIEPQDSVFLKHWQGEKLHINCAHSVDNFGLIRAEHSAAARSHDLAYFGAWKIFFSVR